MPSSTPKLISWMTEQILKANPRTVLDVGVGYGKWGFLIREYIESWQGRIYPGDWAVDIVGVEICCDYITGLPWYATDRGPYDVVYCDDARNFVEDQRCAGRNYDLVIAGDVIEHVPKEDGEQLIKDLAAITGKTLLISIPLGEGWGANVIPGDNEAERHQATWTWSEIIMTLGCVCTDWILEEERHEHPKGPLAGLAFTRRKQLATEGHHGEERQTEKHRQAQTER